MSGTEGQRTHRNTCVTPIASNGAACCDVYAVYDLFKSVVEEGKGVSYETPPPCTPLTSKNSVTNANIATTRMDAGESRYAGVYVVHDAGPPGENSAPSSPASPVSARQARRLAKMQRKVLGWWNSLPAEARRTHYLSAQLTQAVGIPTTSLGPALKALGWRREQVRLAGQQVPVWSAPGAPSIKRPRGRPPLPQLAPGGQP